MLALLLGCKLSRIPEYDPALQLAAWNTRSRVGDARADCVAAVPGAHILCGCRMQQLTLPKKAALYTMNFQPEQRFEQHRTPCFAPPRSP
jgi:hypothetical protein